MSLIDLTQLFSDGMFSLKLFPRVSVERCIRIEERGLNVTTVGFAVHSGTHIDSPRHFFADGRTMDRIELDETSGPAVALSVDLGDSEEIRVEDLERQTPGVERNDIVFISTGYGKYFYDDHERYRRHPHLSVEAADWLVSRQVKMVAMDIPTPEQPEDLRGADFDWPIHHRLLGNGVLVAEHVANLERVVGKRFRAFAFPLPIKGSDGSPVRMVAEL